MPFVDPRLPRALRRAWCALVAVASAYVALLAIGWAAGAPLLAPATHESIQFALLAAGTTIVAARAVALSDDRPAWLVMSAGFVVWTLGQLVAALLAPSDAAATTPSALDAAMLGSYTAQYAAAFLLARGGAKRVPRATWLDGAIAVLLLGAIGVHWVLVPLLDGGEHLGVAIMTIAYPAFDLVLLGLVGCVIVLHGGRPDSRWWAFAVGFGLTALADGAYALDTVRGVTPNTTTGPLTILYTLGGLVLVAAAIWRPRPRPAGSLDGWRAVAVPVVFSTLVLALLVVNAIDPLDSVAQLLVIASAALIAVRAAIAFRENIALADSHRQALTDELTGLDNRRSASAVLEARFAAGGTVSALMIDLDRFKELNDTLGHLAGDEALIAVANRLRTAVGDAGRLFRLGGDEFAVILRPGHGGAEALTIARRLLDALDEPVTIDGLRLPVRASVGVAALGEGTPAELLRHADVAMYHAKAHGSGVEVYAPERDVHSRERLALAAELHDAITGGQLVLHFQPKASLRTGEIVGVEALVRWLHPTRGLVPPGEFVPLVERSGLGRLLTIEVIGLALRAERAWRTAGVEVPVAVNTSAATLLDVRFPDDVAQLLEAWDAPPGALALELTEETIMTDPERAQDVLARLSEVGVDLSLDDFGTGYSSLSMLKRLPVRELKIDRSFVMDLLDDPGDAAIVRSTVDLAHNIGLRVVAEGVESAEAWDLLAAWGCDVAQGFHLSRPVPEAELLELLLARGARAA